MVEGARRGEDALEEGGYVDIFLINKDPFEVVEGTEKLKA